MGKHNAKGRDADPRLGNRNPAKRGRDADGTKDKHGDIGRPKDDGRHSDTNRKGK